MNVNNEQLELDLEYINTNQGNRVGWYTTWTLIVDQDCIADGIIVDDKNYTK